MNDKTPAKIPAEIYARAEQYDSEQIEPLDGLSDPLVNSMQQVIKTQQLLLNEAADAMSYLLGRKCRDARAQDVMYMTEAESRLVTALARIKNVPRATIAADYKAYHSYRDNYGCVDDKPNTEEAA